MQPASLRSSELITAVAARNRYATPVATRASPLMLAFVVAWKIATESLFIASGAPIWELVERSGSYAAPLALAVLQLHAIRVARQRLLAA